MAEEIKIDVKADDEASKNIDKVDSKIKSISKSASKAAISMGKMAVKAGAIAAVAGLGAAAKGAADFEARMRNVNTIARLNEEELKVMSDRLLDMSKTFPDSATSIADGMFQIQSAGFAADDAFTILQASLTAGVAGLTDTEVAADAITTVINAYGLASSDAAAVSDLMFKTAERGKTTFPELASAMSQVVSTASAAGVSFDEISAAFATMTKQGLSTDEASTALNQTILGIIKPSEDLARVIEELGFANGAALLKSEGLAGTMGLLNDKFGGNIDAMSTMLPNIRALKGALTLTGEGAAIFAEDLVGMADASGAATAAFEEQSKGTSLQWQLLKNNVNAFLITIGQGLLPVINTIISTVLPVLDMAAEGMSIFWERNGETIKETFKSIMKVVNFGMAIIVTVIKAGLALSMGNVDLFKEQITKAWELIMFGIKFVVFSGMNAVVEAIEAGLNEVIDLANDTIDRINEVLPGFLKIGKLGKISIEGFDLPETPEFKSILEETFGDIFKAPEGGLIDIEKAITAGLGAGVAEAGAGAGIGIPGITVPGVEVPGVTPAVAGGPGVVQINNPTFDTKIEVQKIDESNIDTVADRLNRLQFEKLASRSGIFVGTGL